MDILITGTSSGLGKYLLRKIPSEKYNRNFPNSFENKKFDLIIHAACGMPKINECFDDYHLYQKKILDNLLKLSFEKFIFISSIEASEVNSTFSDYALNKIKLEKIIMKNLSNFLIIRPTLLLGPDMRFNQILKIATKSKSKLSLSPESSFNLIYYSDILPFIKGEFSGVINLMSKNNVTLGEVAKYFDSLPNWGKYKYVTPIPSEINSYVSNSKGITINSIDRFSKFISIKGWNNKLSFDTYFC